MYMFGGQAQREVIKLHPHAHSIPTKTTGGRRSGGVAASPAQAGYEAVSGCMASQKILIHHDDEILDLADVWRFAPTLNTVHGPSSQNRQSGSWEQLRSMARKPVARRGAVAWTVKNGGAIIFGQAVCDETPSSSLDLSAMTGPLLLFDGRDNWVELLGKGGKRGSR